MLKFTVLVLVAATAVSGSNFLRNSRSFATRSKRDVVCPSEDPQNPVYFPHPDDCTKFYECSGGVAVEQECPPDLVFNPTLKVCDWPNNAECTASENNEAKYSNPPKKCPSGSDNANNDEKDCRSFDCVELEDRIVFKPRNNCQKKE